MANLDFTSLFKSTVGFDQIQKWQRFAEQIGSGPADHPYQITA